MTADKNPVVKATDDIDVVRSSKLLIGTAIVVGFIGAIAIIGNVALMAYEIHEFGLETWGRIPWSFKIWNIAIRIVAMLVGVAWLVAAVRIWRGRWRLGIVICTIAILVGLANPHINRVMRHALGGDQPVVLPPAPRRGT